MKFLRALTAAFLFVSLAACSTMRVRHYKEYWCGWQTLSYNREQLQTGDILVVKREYNPIGFVGHAAVVLEKGEIGEYPKVGSTYWKGPTYVWLYERSEMVVLRYRHFTPQFKERFLENAAKLKNGYWAFSLDKKNNQVFYCSQYVWYLYYASAKDLGYNLDLDANGGLLVLPYDFIGNDELMPLRFEREFPREFGTK